MRRKRELVTRLLLASGSDGRMVVNPKDYLMAHILNDFCTRNREILGFEKNVFVEKDPEYPEIEPEDDDVE